MDANGLLSLLRDEREKHAGLCIAGVFTLPDGASRPACPLYKEEAALSRRLL